MNRITFARISVLMLVVAGLALQGCGGDDNGGISASDMARIDAAEAAAAAAEAEADRLAAELADLEAQVDAAEPEVDTSALDEAIAALQEQIEALTEKTADPETPMEILGGAEGTLSANDRAALATSIAGQLNATYDHDGDMSMVNLAELSGDPAAEAKQVDMTTRNIAHASGDGIMADKGGFLKHAFKSGTMVDLSSPGDIATLSLSNLLKVDGVNLMSFSLRETDKVMTAATDADGGTGTTHTTTTTLGADGSMSVVRTIDTTKAVTYSQTTTYVGGSKIVETPTASGADDANAQAMITLADGRTASYRADASKSETDYTRTPTGTTYAGAAEDASSPAADLADALMMYKNPGSMYTVAQHTAAGYGAWLADSFFVAYVINAEDDAIISDPDEMAYKIAWGGRTHDSAMASNLSGRGETAMWKGLMLGHDMDADASTYGDMLKGNASITARIGAETLADQARAADLVDVSLTNIINDAGEDSRVPTLEWTNLDLAGGSFGKGTEIQGAFYDNGNEVVGEFNKSKIVGVFGAVEAGQ